MQFIKGMDVSMIADLEKRGAVYYCNGIQEDPFSILKKCGANLIRLRLWVHPFDESGNSYGGGGNDLETTIQLAHRAAENDMGILLDIHYSDFWADPSKQMKPKAWRNLSGQALEQKVYQYTSDVLAAFADERVAPRMIQVGNEITNGLLWPDGHINQPARMAALLQSGICAVRARNPKAKVVLHLDFGTDNKMYRKWFDQADQFHLDFDVIGMSYYPHWNGSMKLLLENMNDVSGRYDKEVMIAETSIGYTTDTLDCFGIVFSEEEEKATGYVASQDGQEAFLRDLCRTVRSVKNNKGIGVCYWEPAWLPIQDCTWGNENGCVYMNDKVQAGNTMANQALFDRNGNANSALLHLREM